MTAERDAPVRKEPGRTAAALSEAGREAHRRGLYAEAHARFRDALRDDPVWADALEGVGVIHLQSRRPDLADVFFRRALAAATAAAATAAARLQYHHALALESLGRTGEAVNAHHRATLADPGYEPPYQPLARLLLAQGRRVDAALVWTAYGRMRFRLRSPELAEEAFRQAIEIDPACDEARLALAPLARFFGRYDEAREAYMTVLARRPGHLGARLGLCMAHLRIIYPDQRAAHAAHDAYIRELATLHRLVATAPPEALAAGEGAVGDCKPFYLSYHGFNDRDAQRLYGDATARIMAQAHPLPAAAPRPPAAGRRLRVGFVSAYLYEHSVSKLFAGWAEKLDRERFEVCVYHLTGGADGYTERFRAGAAVFRQGLGDTRAWTAAIRADALDALIYLDIGMSGQEVRLAALRLAPVQAMAWGHPITSGLPTIDYFLSSALMEPFNGDDHYTEKLIRLPNLSVFYEPVRYPAEAVYTRAEAGVEDDDVVFICCQSLFKYLPQYDWTFAEIARRLPRARFLFIRHHLPEVTAVFQARLDEAFAARGLQAAERCRLLERIPRDRFGAYLALGDVYLDSIGWSGGNTTLEAMACDLPAVTLACDLMRGRHTTGILKRLGLDPFITHSLEEFVDKATLLGGDPGLRRRARAHIAAHKALLYRDEAPVRALEAFLIRATEAAA